ncbi:Hypothetical predicted protein [Drosophila guanche]|uniref:Uncharacterized protein n=1 Tax=Drosophila guanche TaxID=7266 RepID=A0A3B0JRS4_DROGU|nr:Hypothetical predicted protein [Drosophila guanche]
MSLRNQKSQTSVAVIQSGRQGTRRPSAGPDEINNIFIKKIVSDWRNSVRERRYTTHSDRSTRPSRSEERQGGSKKTLTTASYSRPSIQRPQLPPPANKPLEIEYGQSSGEADRILVSEGVDLYIHQPIKASFSKPLPSKSTPPPENL